jgi:hypothetical protein
MCGTPAVYGTAKAEYLAFASLIGAFLHPGTVISLADDSYFVTFFRTSSVPCCSLI